MGFGELLAYKKAFGGAMQIFQASKSFPKEEKYSLTDSDTKNSENTSLD